VSASFKVTNSTSITAYAPNGVPDGSTVPVYANIPAGHLCVKYLCFIRPASTVPSTAAFTYSIGELDIWGPYPHFYSQGSNDQAWQSQSSSLHEELFRPPDTLPFALPNQTFHVATYFNDQSGSFPENQSGTWGSNGQYRNLGDTGGYGASLQVCDVENGVSQKYGPCTNWDGNTGYWEDVPSTYVSDTLTSPGGDGTTHGDLAIQAPDPNPNQTLSDHVATYCFEWYVSETDSHGGTPLYRSSNGFSNGFNVIWAPVVYAQMTVEPYTILYHPTGDLSKASYTTNLGFGTDYKLSNESTTSDSYKDTQTNSAKFEDSITAGILGVNFSDSYKWDNSTVAGFGSTVSSSDESTDTTAIKTTWAFNNPDNSLVPGDGSTCAPPVQTGQSWDCSTGDLIHPSRLAQYTGEPFWEDEFLLNLHTQYRVYEVSAGQSLWITKAAVPTLAHVSVLQLEDCRIGQWSAGVDPCLIQFGGVDITYNGNVVYHPTSCNNMPPQTPEDSCVELTSQEAANLLALDPFYGAGQGADVQTSRGIPISPNVGSYGASYPYNEKNPLDFSQSWDNTNKTTQGSGTVLTSKSGYSDVNTTDVGGGFTLTESYGGLSEKGTMTLSSGEQTSEDYSQETKYSDSTANTTTQETTAAVDLNDFDNTTSASPSCPKCHNPMPQQPEANVYLDRAFGTFMYQDPNAPGSPSLIGKLATYKRYLAINYLGTVNGQAVSRERFVDVRPGDPTSQAIDVLTYLGYMSANADDAFRPSVAITRIELAGALGGMVHLAPSRVLTLTFGSSRGQNMPVTEAALVTGLVKTLKIKKGVAMGYLKQAFHSYASRRTVTRGQAAEVLFDALRSSCLEGCSFNKVQPPVTPVQNVVSLAVGPSGGSALQGQPVSATVQTDQYSGRLLRMKLGIRGLPSGATASLKPASLLAGKSSKLTIRTASSTPPGTYPITIAAAPSGPVSAGSTRTVTYELTVNPVKVATKFQSFQCSSSGSNNISCQGTLDSTVVTPAGGPTPLANRIVRLTYSPPDGSAPVVDIAQTAADGSFSDTLTTPTGGPLTAGTWQVAALYAGDRTTNPTNGSQSVIVQGP
jgi:hypothetical protein